MNQGNKFVMDSMVHSVSRSLNNKIALSVPVNTSPAAAYARLKREAREASLPQLERSYFFYKKPKYARQEQRKEFEKRLRHKEFNEKLFMALDMMKSGF